MRTLLSTLAIAMATLAPTAAFAASGDTPSLPIPKGVDAAAEATGSTPWLGTGSTDPEEIRSRGAVIPGEQAFPPNGLSTVAYGKLGKTESIISWDSRTRGYTTTYPNRAIVFIEYNGSHMCTGWLYSPNTVATAGHCVHSGGSSGSWYDRTKYKIYPGRDGTASPYGYCTVKWISSVTGWTSSGNYTSDFGVMKLNCSIGNTTGYFRMYAHANPVGQPAIVGGYPGDKPRTMWTSSDKIRYATNDMLGYRMDTIGGHSGSPIWHDAAEATATTGAWAFGIHNYGVGAVGSNSNGAARLTSSRLTLYNNWKNAP